MKIQYSNQKARGIALILVLISVVVLAVLAAGFAYSMRVEVKLARNASSERELEWLGRSGVELARYALAQQLAITAEPWDSLNQKWAGGPGGLASSNSPLTDLQLENVELGGGRITVKIEDCERKMNINAAPEPMLRLGLTLAGMDAAGAETIVACIQDWVDANDLTLVGGAEKDYYENGNPAYEPKNGPIDDLSEMLLIKGVTPELLWGAANENRSQAAFQAKGIPRGNGANGGSSQYNVGLADLFVPVSIGQINVNTASATALLLLPFMDENLAQEIIRARAGLDGMDGTEDDQPFQNGAQLGRALPPQMVAAVTPFCCFRSVFFKVTVDAEINGYQRRFVALLSRTNPRNIQVSTFSSQ